MIIFLVCIIAIIYECNGKTIIVNHNFSRHKLPKFWTNTGFCPFGTSISESLLSNSNGIRIHLNLIGSLPNNAISSVRVHWLLDLIEFKKFRPNNKPIYDFKKLDQFLSWIDEADLNVGFEIMGNPGGIFSNLNTSMASFLWNDLSFQIAERYLDYFGENKVSNWKFESWNEPDLKTYNKLNFTTNEYLNYLNAVREGLNRAKLKLPTNKLSFRGPAGLFKSHDHHPLCWAALEHCNLNSADCPFDVLTFHRKGNGNAQEVLDGEQNLLTELFTKYRNLSNFPISNDEADPIAGWSTPRSFQSDIRYACKVVLIILKHWSAKILNENLFKNLESISHDNAFLSYHPYEFDQRTLFARFQMNHSQPIYSQFIAKPIYTALGMLGNLGEFANNIEMYSNITILTTSSASSLKYYLAMIFVSDEENVKKKLSFQIILPEFQNSNEKFAYCFEILETNETNPVELWNLYGRQSYPNATVREWMRKVQGPKIIENRILTTNSIPINYEFKSPWIGILRVCSSEINNGKLLKPTNLRILKITNDEIIIFWNETPQLKRCIKTYIVEFMMKKRRSSGNDINNLQEHWETISKGWTVPFLSFQFRPKDGQLSGYYKVKSVDIFGHVGPSSDAIYFS